MTDVRDVIGAQNDMPAMLNHENGTFVAIIAAGDAGNRNVVTYLCGGY